MRGNVTFLFISVVVFGVSFVSSQIFIPVIHPLSGETKNVCNLSANATDDYYNVRDFVYTFLETAEVEFRRMNDHEKMLSCQLAKGNLSDLIKKAKVDWENCLTDNYAFFGDFVNDTLQNFLDFFCENGEHVAGYFTEEAKQCRLDITKPMFDNCLATLYSSNHKKTDYSLSFNTFVIPGNKDNLCRKILDMNPCIVEVLEQHCPHLDYYRTLSGKLLAQTIRPCDEYIIYLSAARIVGWTLFVLSVLIILIVRFFPVSRWYADFRQRATSKIFTNSVI